MDIRVDADVELGFEPDLGAILRPLRRGRYDPSMRYLDAVWWRTATTPDGPVTQALLAQGRRVTSRAWGPGANWQSARLPALVGAGDTTGAGIFGQIDQALPTAPGLPPVSRRLRRWRTPRSENVWDSLLAAVIEQRVTGKESKSTWAALLRDYGTIAPGPLAAPLRVPPEPAVVRRIPSWWWRRRGVDRQRSDTIMRLTRLSHVFHRMLTLEATTARETLAAVPGVGAWTCAEVAQRALGDADAVSVGDYHQAGQVVYAFTGDWGGTDERMLQLLQPFQGDRYRVVRAIELAGISKPRRGPRMTIPAHQRG